MNIHTAKTNFSRLVDEVSAGNEIIIARAGKPVAKLVPLTTPQSAPKRVLGILGSRLSVPDDFDAPLPEETLAGFEGR